jgi:hypothetical protein
VRCSGLQPAKGSRQSDKYILPESSSLPRRLPMGTGDTLGQTGTWCPVASSRPYGKPQPEPGVGGTGGTPPGYCALRGFGRVKVVPYLHGPSTAGSWPCRASPLRRGGGAGRDWPEPGVSKARVERQAHREYGRLRGAPSERPLPVRPRERPRGCKDAKARL